MSKRKMEFDDYDDEPVKRSHKKKVTKEYRWYGCNSEGMIAVFDGPNPPTLTYDRIVTDGDTEDENYTFIENKDAFEIHEYDAMSYDDFQTRFGIDAQEGQLFRGPIPDPDEIELEEWFDSIPEERTLIDGEEDGNY